MTRDDFRRIALSLPETDETDDDGIVHFRIRGRAFARLPARDFGWADVRLSRRDSELCGAGEPEIFAPLPSTWFHTGYTQINLRKCGEHTLRSALAAAWREVAPKRLAARLG
ncbi:MAG TPA: MmcQ/YjbR family DNA-binding protein [Bauldia sp.]|nr:MmcQ/YjbR family DNA-binding protein [Bauldia sp.]